MASILKKLLRRDARILPFLFLAAAVFIIVETLLIIFINQRALDLRPIATTIFPYLFFLVFLVIQAALCIVAARPVIEKVVINLVFFFVLSIGIQILYEKLYYMFPVSYSTGPLIQTGLALAKLLLSWTVWYMLLASCWEGKNMIVALFKNFGKFLISCVAMAGWIGITYGIYAAAAKLSISYSGYLMISNGLKDIIYWVVCIVLIYLLTAYKHKQNQALNLQ